MVSFCYCTLPSPLWDENIDVSPATVLLSRVTLLVQLRFFTEVLDRGSEDVW